MNYILGGKQSGEHNTNSCMQRSVVIVSIAVSSSIINNKVGCVNGFECDLGRLAGLCRRHFSFHSRQMKTKPNRLRLLGLSFCRIIASIPSQTTTLTIIIYWFCKLYMNLLHYLPFLADTFGLAHYVVGECFVIKHHLLKSVKLWKKNRKKKYLEGYDDDFCGIKSRNDLKFWCFVKWCR